MIQPYPPFFVFKHGVLTLANTMPSNLSADAATRRNLRKECYTGRWRNTPAKYIPEDKLVDEKWPEFLDLQVKLPEPGEAVALVEMRKMCPGKAATLAEIEEASRETHFRTPHWKGKAADTDILERVLSPAEVDAINRKYLELDAAFLAKRQGQAAGEAIAEAEQNTTAQILKAQELIVEVRREMNAGFTEIKGLEEEETRRGVLVHPGVGWHELQARDRVLP